MKLPNERKPTHLHFIGRSSTSPAILEKQSEAVNNVGRSNETLRKRNIELKTKLSVQKSKYYELNKYFCDKIAALKQENYVTRCQKEVKIEIIFSMKTLLFLRSVKRFNKKCLVL